MRYLGGKAKIARHVVDLIERYRAPAQPVWEPFCGGLNVTRELARRGIDVIATDASWPLIALVQAVRAGWQPPAALSRDEWRAARALPASNPLHGFAGYTSFGGDYGGGYAAPRRDNHFDQTRRALAIDALAPAHVQCVDFLAVDPWPINALLYCDPPYAGRTGYAACAPFDHDRFVERVGQWAALGVTVLVSEYAFPLGECVWEFERAAGLRGRESRHVERLFKIGGKHNG